LERFLIDERHCADENRGAQMLTAGMVSILIATPRLMGSIDAQAGSKQPS